MTQPANPAERMPKGDHNRRLSLGMEIEEFAAAAGLTRDQVYTYEMTPVDGTFDLEIAHRIGTTLERLEATRTPRVENGPAPDQGG